MRQEPRGFLGLLWACLAIVAIVLCAPFWFIAGAWEGARDEWRKRMRPPPRYHVVHPWVEMLDEPFNDGAIKHDYTVREWIEKEHADLRMQRIWSISTDPNIEGWDTDNGMQIDGGLTYDAAVAIVEAANRGARK